METSTLNRRVTIYDIAKAMGVSPMTVSLALRGENGVSEARRNEVRRVAGELGYIPKAAAQMLRGGKTGFIGLLLGSSRPEQLAEEGFQSPILAHFLSECQQIGKRYMVDFSSGGEDGAYVPPGQVTGGFVDGVVLAGYVSSQLREWLTTTPAGLQVPWVGIDEPSRHCVMSMTSVGIRNAVRHLRQLGHTRIAFWAGTRKFTAHRVGFDSYIEAVKEFGIETCGGRWVTADESIAEPQPLMAQAASDDRWAQRMLEEVPGVGRPTAFLVQSINIARAVIRTAELQGLRVPEDVSVTALGPSYLAETLTPAITTIEHDFQQLVRRSVVRLAELVDGKAVDERPVMVPMKFVIRQTTGPAKH